MKNNIVISDASIELWPWDLVKVCLKVGKYSMIDDGKRMGRSDKIWNLAQRLVKITLCLMRRTHAQIFNYIIADIIIRVELRPAAFDLWLLPVPLKFADRCQNRLIAQNRMSRSQILKLRRLMKVCRPKEFIKVQKEQMPTSSKRSCDAWSKFDNGQWHDNRKGWPQR